MNGNYSTYLKRCTKDQLEKIFGEFDRTEEKAIEDAKYLIQWMQQQPHLPNVQDEDLLITFLCRGKFHLERTKKILDSYYTTRALMPEIFENIRLLSEGSRKLRKVTSYIPMRNLTPEGYRVLLIPMKPHTKDDLIFSYNDLLRAHQCHTDILAKFDRHMGLITVIDVKHVSTDFQRFLIPGLKKYIDLAMNGSPLRLHKIYLLNLSPIAEILIRLMKSMAKKKMADRLIVWQKPVEEFSTILPAECLPKEYGGIDKSMNELEDEWLEKIHKPADEWLQSQESMKADFSKKSLEQSFKTSDFGIQGSFRKITLD